MIRCPLYQQGEFVDLCRGPHVPSTGHIKTLKLLSSAGAYWRGDERNPMLQRHLWHLLSFRRGFADSFGQFRGNQKAAIIENRAKTWICLVFKTKPDLGLILWHPKGITDSSID